MVHTFGSRTLKKRKEILLKRDVKGIRLWSVGFVFICLRIGSSGYRRINILFTILVLPQFEILRSVMGMLQYLCRTYTCDILYAFLTCFSERVSCYCWSFRMSQQLSLSAALDASSLAATCLNYRVYWFHCVHRVFLFVAGKWRMLSVCPASFIGFACSSIPRTGKSFCTGFSGS